MDLRQIQQQLNQLHDRIELLHVNLQTVSSRTLSNSRTHSLEDRLTQLEQDQIPPEPTLTTEILDDISRQMGICDQQLQNLENKMKDFLDNLDKKITKCDLKADTYQNDYYEWMDNGGKKTTSKFIAMLPPRYLLIRPRFNR